MRRPATSDIIPSQEVELTAELPSEAEVKKKVLEVSGKSKEESIHLLTRCSKCQKPTTKKCTGCEAVYYCNEICQKRHWKEHSVLCHAIKVLSARQDEMITERCMIKHLRTEERKLVQLVGRRCTVQCQLHGVDATALWDTGAEVSLVSKEWLEKNLPEVKMESVSSLLGVDLKVEGVGNNSIPYIGYAMLNVRIDKTELEVPFLITKEVIIEPIIGYNVIELLTKEASKNEGGEVMLNEGFNHLNGDQIHDLNAFLVKEKPSTLSKVTISKVGAVIPAGSVTKLKCKISRTILDKSMPVLFERFEDLDEDCLLMQDSLHNLKKGSCDHVDIIISNTGTQPIRLKGKTEIGQLNFVKSIIPAQVKPKDESKSTMVERQSSENHETEPIGLCKDTYASISQVKKNIIDESTMSPASKNQSDKDGLCEPPDTESDKMLRQCIEEMKFDQLTETQQAEVREMLWEERKAFAVGEEIGCAPDLVMSLDTTDEVPVQKNYNSIPRHLHDAVKDHVQDLLNKGWIKKSTSAWSSPVVVVRKKDGDIRLCCDYRKLNQKTIPDKHPLPRVQMALDNLQGSKFFSVLDQSRAYYQGFVDEESSKKTAFATPWGLYEWVRIPFGLMNAVAKFQRYMEETLEDCRDDFAMPYLDDTIVYSTSFEKHINDLRIVLKKFQARGLKLKLEKCEFFRNEVQYLGRIVNEEGYRMNEDTITAVKALKDVKPTNVGQIRQILGLVGYHRKHIQDFARIAKPLNQLLQGEHEVEASSDVKKAAVSSRKSIEWLPVHQLALDTLIDAVTSPPILAYPNFELPFFVHTDASKDGLGCILYQEQDGKIRAISYGSRSLKKAEMNYHSSKLEFLALKWAVTEHFHDYLAYADKFTVYTDNNPLLYVMDSAKLNSISRRWISELSEYNFDIKFRAGVINRDADCLSRMPLDIERYTNLCKESCDNDEFRAILTAVHVQETNEECWLASNNDCFDRAVAANAISVQAIGKDGLLRAQKEEKWICQAREIVQKGIHWKKMPGFVTKETKLLMRDANNLFIDNEDKLLKRRSGNWNQIVLPLKLRNTVFKQLHENMGHLGAERVFDLARKRVYWPRMYTEIAEYVQHRCRCNIQQRPHVKQVAPLQSIHTAVPMELISIDYLKLEKSSGGHEYILLIVDHFSRYAQGYATRSKCSKTAAKHLFNDFVLRFGIPGRILHDQGREFENKLFKSLEEYNGVIKSRTTPYHPMGNGAVERMNSTLLKMLRTLPETQKNRWHENVSKMLFAYNSTRHDTTGYSPFYVMFGREPVLPIDAIFGIDEENFKKESQFVKRWKQEMNDAYKVVRENISQKKQAAEKHWGKNKLMATALQLGDRVLVKNVREKGGPGKLRSYFEPDVYVITKVGGDGGVVYWIQKEGLPKSEVRTVHRNLLKPCPLMNEEEKIEVPVTKPKKGTGRNKRAADTTEKEETESDRDIELLPSQIELLSKPIPAARSRRNDPPCMSTPTRETPQPVPRKDRMQRCEQPVMVELIPEEIATEMYPENRGLPSSIVAGSEAPEEEGRPDDVSDNEESSEAESFHGFESSEEGAVEMHPKNGGLSSSIVTGREIQGEDGEPDVSGDEESREAESFHDIEFQNSNNDVGIENAEVTGASLQDEDLEIEKNFDRKSDNDEDDLESSEQRRASTKRISKPRKLLTYNELGGQPSYSVPKH